MVVQGMLSSVLEINYVSSQLYFATDRIMVIHPRLELLLCSPFLFLWGFFSHHVKDRISTLEPSRLCL